MEEIVIQLLNTLSFIAIFGLIGVGLAVLLGLMGVINLAHGEFVMLGAYVTWWINLTLNNYWIGLTLAVVSVGTFSLLIERSLIRSLYDRPMETILATWGLGIVLREMAKLIFGKTHRMVEAPFPGSISFFGLEYSAYRIFIIITGFIVLFGVVVFFLKTDYGSRARAIIYNKEMASALGINTTRVNQVMFAIGASLAALAGALICPIYVTYADMGMPWLVGSFFVVVIGGVESIWGPMGGSVVYGGTQGISEFFMNAVASKILVLLIAIIVVRLRPHGLFAKN